MKFEYKIKKSFRAVELLLYVPRLKESPSLEKNILTIGREYYFVVKKLGNEFIYYHINTSNASATFDRIIKLGIELRQFLLNDNSIKDFLIYSFSRVIQKDKSFFVGAYKKRILHLYKKEILHSLFFVDNYIELAMRDDFVFKRITEKEFLLKERIKEPIKKDLLIPVFIGRDQKLRDIRAIYDNICGSLSNTTWVDLRLIHICGLDLLATIKTRKN